MTDALEVAVTMATSADITFVQPISRASSLTTFLLVSFTEDDQLSIHEHMSLLIHLPHHRNKELYTCKPTLFHLESDYTCPRCNDINGDSIYAVSP